MMPRIILNILVVVFMSGSYLLADELRDPMDAKDLPEYNQVRDPFWPIGHARKIKPKVDTSKPVQPDQPKVFEPKWPKLKLKAITTTPKGHIAIIAQVGLVEEGQVFSRKVENVIYTWRIDKISSKGFTYTQIEAKPAK